MPEIATGRSRIVSVSATATHDRIEDINNSGVPEFGQGAGSAAGWGCQASLTVGIVGPGIEEDPDHDVPGEVRWRASANVVLTFTGGYSGMTGPITETVTVYSSWVISGSLPLPGGVGAGIVTFQGSASTSASVYLEERAGGPAGVRAYLERLTRYAGSASAGGSGEVEFTGSGLPTSERPAGVPRGEFVPFLFAGILLGDDTLYPDPPEFTLSQYEHSLSVSGWEASASFAATGPGLSHDETLVIDETRGSLSQNGTGTLTGGVGSLSLATQRANPPGAIRPNGYGQLTASPEWAAAFTVDDWDYETAAPVSVTKRLLWGGQVLATGTGPLRWPASGLTSYVARSFAVDYAGSSSSTRNRRLFAADGLADPNKPFTLRVDGAWADGYGSSPGSDARGGNAARYYWIDASPTFYPVSLTLADPHLFGVFDGLGRLQNGLGTLDLDGGIVRHQPGGAPGRFSVGQAVPFCPLGYRFYRFQARADQDGAGLHVVMQRYLRTVDGVPYYHRAVWERALTTAGQWQTVEIDFAYPTRIETEVVPPEARYVHHPQLYQATLRATQAQRPILEFRTRTPGAVYHFDALEGYHRADGNRTPRLLVCPVNADALKGVVPETNDRPPADHWGGIRGTETAPAAFADVALGGGPAGALKGLLAVNGVRAWELTGTVAGWVDLLDTATRDSGITVAEGASPWTALGSSFVVPRDGFGAPLPPHAALAANVPVALPARWQVGGGFGYYGMGDAVGGAHGAELQFQGERVWNGEILAHATRGATQAPAGTAVELRDNNGGGLADTGTADDDGLLRLFGRYGVLRPYRSTPEVEPVPDNRREWSGTAAGGYTYTAQGAILGPYWLKSSAFRLRDSGDFATFGGIRDAFAIIDGLPGWYDLDLRAPSLPGLCNVHDRWGRYYVATRNATGILVARSDFSTPPFAVESQATGPADDSSPALLPLPTGPAPLLLLWERAGAVYESRSYDDGLTWEAPVTMFLAGTQPHLARDPVSGAVLRAAFVDPLIRATLQYPGDAAPGAEFTFKGAGGADLQWEPDGFDVSPAGEGPGRWLLLAVALGETEVSHWLSTDHAATWTRL